MMSTCRFTPKERSGQMRLPSAWCGAGCDDDGVMAMEDLQKQFVTLATLEETEAPVISCYLNLAAGQRAYRSVLEERARLLSKRMPEGTRRPLEEALDRIEGVLRTSLAASTQGVAIFARGGSRSFFSQLQFRVPLPNWIAVGSTPNIYHLIELQDMYHSYVMILCAEKGVRIFAINVDAWTEELWTTQPELRRRVGPVWAKEQYCSHRFGLTNESTNEEVMILDQIMSGGGHGHLILAGDPLMISKVRSTLPHHLAAKLMDIISSSGEHMITNVVAVTLFSLIEYASRESLSTLDELGKEIDADGLAVAGAPACLKVLKEGRADTLIMSPIYPPEPGWMCAACGHTDAGGPPPQRCPRCKDCEILAVNIKEVIYRLARKTRCRIELLADSDCLKRLGGIGCLLRYPEPEAHYRRAA